MNQKDEKMYVEISKRRREIHRGRKKMTNKNMKKNQPR